MYLQVRITLKNNHSYNLGYMHECWWLGDSLWLLKWLRPPYHEWLKRVLNMASQYMSK